MRPAGLTAVCVISLILGLVGGLALVVRGAAYVAQPFLMKVAADFQQSVTRQSPQMQEMQKHQEAMNQEIAAIQRRWLVPSIAGNLIAAVAAVGLVVGAVRGLHMKPRAHILLIAGMAAGILHGLMASSIGYATARETQPIMQRHMTLATQNVGAGLPPAARAMQTSMTNSMMQVGTALGFVFIFGWTFVKCAVYAVCIWYLQTPRIRKLFEGDGSDRAVIDALSDAPS